MICKNVNIVDAFVCSLMSGNVWENLGLSTTFLTKKNEAKVYVQKCGIPRKHRTNENSHNFEILTHHSRTSYATDMMQI